MESGGELGILAWARHGRCLASAFAFPPGSDPAAARNVLAHPHYTPCPIRTSPIAAEPNFLAISFLQILGALLAHTGVFYVALAEV